MNDTPALSRTVMVGWAIALLLTLFALPAALLWVDTALAPGAMYGLVPLVLVNPIVYLILGAVAGRHLGGRAWLPLAAALALFVVSALGIYNSSALGYLALYAPLAAIGCAGGIALRGRSSRAQAA